MLGEAVPSGSVTPCLHQDLADTCSHQSHLRIVHSPFPFCSPYTPTHELSSHESACMPDLYLLPVLWELLTLMPSFSLVSVYRVPNQSFLLAATTLV